MKKLLLPLLLILCLPLMGDEKEDKKLFEETKAKAEKGEADAQYNLGVMYDKGEGVLEDDKEAVKWWRKAAEQGEDLAQISLGIMCFNGEGVLEDIATAYAWFNIAQANGNENGKGNKGILAKKMTPEQLAKAQELSKEMIKKNPKLLQKKK